MRLLRRDLAEFEPKAQAGAAAGPTPKMLTRLRVCDSRSVTSSKVRHTFRPRCK